jgi:dTDP-L-rhamnose 4-epimerase
MSKGRVLITGGAGFIGSHLADLLLTSGYEVRILDALLPQVHPSGRPSYLNPNVELLTGDVRDAASVEQALDGVELLVHFAAAVGVGQSMYEVTHYCSVNVLGTATLLEAIVKGKRPLRRMLVASSMSIYGEGLYECPSCGPQAPGPRPAAQLAERDWEMRCPRCQAAMAPRPTPESKPLVPTSIYAVNKRDQEEMVLTMGRSLAIPAVALRFFNVYGTRQALSNPYTGVAAIFSSALLNGTRPLVFEDGHQLRDFIHVGDIVEACRLALEKDEATDQVLNVGTGQPTDLLRLAALLKGVIAPERELEPEIMGRFRAGDIRACYADVTRARDRLGFSARFRLEDGVKELAAWVAGETSRDDSRRALQELDRMRLIR